MLWTGAVDPRCPQVSILHQNVLDADISAATALFVYLVPEGMVLVKDRLAELVAAGSRVVSYVFSIPGMVPTRIVTYKKVMKIYLYTSIRSGE